MNKTARDMCVPILISTLFDQMSGINLKDDGYNTFINRFKSLSEGPDEETTYLGTKDYRVD